MNLWAQIIGIFAIIASAISPHFKTKHKVLIFHVISSLLHALEYLLLQGYSAVATNIIDAFWDFVYAKYAKDKKKTPKKYLVIYTIIILITGIFAFTNIISILPIILSIISAYAKWQDNLSLYRIIAVFLTLGWLIYNLCVGAYVGVIGNVFQLSSLVLAIYRLDKKH